jgi:hypothetical protein
LFIGESQTLATKHLAQHLDLFFLVRDDRLLMSVDPADVPPDIWSTPNALSLARHGVTDEEKQV